MIPSVSLEAERELTDGARFYAREANAELGLAFIAEFERSLAGPLRGPVNSSVGPHKLERPAREEEVHETHAHHRHSLRRARCTSGG